MAARSRRSGEEGPAMNRATLLMMGMLLGGSRERLGRVTDQCR
jgi:hypothetical protein